MDELLEDLRLVPKRQQNIALGIFGVLLLSFFVGVTVCSFQY